MSWRRRAMGPGGRGLGTWRWPLTTVLAIAVTIFAALAGDWTTAGVAGALAVVMIGLTVRDVRR